MKKDGLENVHTEPVKVPHWVRGQESAEIIAPHRQPLVMLGLGNSVGTPAGRRRGRSRSSSATSRSSTRPARARQGANRPLQRAVHDLRRDGAVPRRAGRREPRRLARSRRSSAPSALRAADCRTPARCATPKASPKIPAAADHDRGRRRAAANAGPRHDGPSPPQDGGEIPARRRLVQRRRRDSRPRAARRSRGRRRPHRLVGRRHRGRPTTAVDAS